VPDGNPPPNFMAPLSDTNPAVLQPVVLSPAVQVGLTNLSGTITFSDGNIGVAMNNVYFLATSATSIPTAWKTSSMNMNYSFNTTPGSIAAPGASGTVTGGYGTSATVTIGSWNNTWTANVTNGNGNINGQFTFSGTAGGTGAATGSYTSGTATGTASGTAVRVP